VHRLARGRLHAVRPGVYVVGRPGLTREGRWVAAVLSCGPDAVLSHLDAGMHLGILPYRRGPIHVSVRYPRQAQGKGLRVHRRRGFGPQDVTARDGIPVTSIVCTLLDLAAMLPTSKLVRAVNQADALDLVDPERLRRALEGVRRPGAARLRGLLDRQTFRLTRSELERIFLPLAAEAGLPVPETQQVVNGFEVDFYWSDLKLVVETDGLRYHRTPAQQQRDHLRGQAHAAAGLTPLRYTHDQIAFDRGYVVRNLAKVARRLMA
jgi:very-short-patch-repair endonuclease